MAGFVSPIDEKPTSAHKIEHRHLAPIWVHAVAARNPLAEILEQAFEPTRERELLEDETKDGELRPVFAGRAAQPPIARR